MGIDIKGVVLFFVALLVLVFIAAIIMVFWWALIPLVVAGVAGIIYWKRQKRASNMV
jgi:hypothetical protein